MMLPLVAVSQRVDLVLRDNGDPERRDALDQAWPRFLAAAGFRAVPMPNHAATALALFTSLPVRGLLLTGGNNLVAYDGDAPERDATESTLLGAARARRIPVIGVCRGMHVLQHVFGVSLLPVEGHVAARQRVRSSFGDRIVNSFHCFGASESAPELVAWATAEDGVVKAVRHATEPLVGIMWHPERFAPFDEADLGLFRSSFAAREELGA
jgi:gamma-glutamyl-gamma-aminobutyrate hydrolase PuuD